MTFLWRGVFAGLWDLQDLEETRHAIYALWPPECSCPRRSIPSRLIVKTFILTQQGWKTKCECLGSSCAQLTVLDASFHYEE